MVISLRLTFPLVFSPPWHFIQCCAKRGLSKESNWALLSEFGAVALLAGLNRRVMLNNIKAEALTGIYALDVAMMQSALGFFPQVHRSEITPELSAKELISAPIN